MDDGGKPSTTDAALTRELVRTYHGLVYEDLPAVSVEAAKQFMLDTLAVAWAGADAPGCGEAHEVLTEEGGAPQATAWGRGSRFPASAAAFLNGISAAALDFDSLAHDSPSHVNVVILPAALAMAEHRHVTGKAFLTALVTGCDLMCRLGAASEATGEKHRGWFYTSVHGVFGAALASAKLIELDIDRTLHALGIAYSQSGGTQQVIVEPGLAKRLGSALAARGGVFAAALAQRGVTAPQAAIEGQYGLFSMYQRGDGPRLLRDLGSSFENNRLSIKKYPSCGCNHAGLEAALQLVAEHDLIPADIEKIEIEVSEYMNRLVGGIFEPRGNLQAVAQFNLPYSIACALTRRKFGLAELESAVITDPGIKALSDRVTVIVDPANKGKRGPAVLRIYSRSKGMLTQRVEHIPGSRQLPLSLVEIESKARDCFALGPRPLGSRAMDELIARISKVEEVADMALFFEGVL